MARRLPARVGRRLALALMLAASGPGSACLTPRAPAAHPGELAPPFELPSDLGGTVSSSDLLDTGQPALLVFYRGHW